eukprot:scaffold84702_cov17-Tisochrysis_lutea.AAC.2
MDRRQREGCGIDGMLVVRSATGRRAAAGLGWETCPSSSRRSGGSGGDNRPPAPPLEADVLRRKRFLSLLTLGVLPSQLRCNASGVCTPVTAGGRPLWQADGLVLGVWTPTFVLSARGGLPELWGEGTGRAGLCAAL